MELKEFAIAFADEAFGPGWRTDRTARDIINDERLYCLFVKHSEPSLDEFLNAAVAMQW